jgi:hypothetical protein
LDNSLEEFIDAGLNQAKAYNALADENANLHHKIFKQSEDGAKLLAKWKDDLLMVQSIHPHSTQFEAGLMEGMKVFVRNIIILVESVEKEL